MGVAKRCRWHVTCRFVEAGGNGGEEAGDDGGSECGELRRYL